MQLPETFLEQMKLLLGTDYDAWLESYDKKPLAGLRCNTAKTYTEEWEGTLSPFPLRRVAWTKTVIISERMQRHPAILIIMQVFIIFRNQVPWHLRLFYRSVRVIKYWIFALHREAKAQSLEQGFRERDCWFPMISATPGPRRC